MRKWQILAIVGFMFGIIGSGWAIAEQQRAASQVYELRVYKTTPGNRGAASAGAHRSATTRRHVRAGRHDQRRLLERGHGDDVEDTFIYMLAYPSREARDEMWRELATFEEFQEIIIAAERDENRALVDSIDARILEPTSYSALK